MREEEVYKILLSFFKAWDSFSCSLNVLSPSGPLVPAANDQVLFAGAYLRFPYPEVREIFTHQIDKANIYGENEQFLMLVLTNGYSIRIEKH